MAPSRQEASFRDPSGFVFYKDGLIHRWVAPEYGDTYAGLVSSGLFRDFAEKGWIVPHQEVTLPDCDEAFRIIRPDQIPLISYPYEWCFSQLKSAALLTLEIQLAAMARGFSLKDASCYNVQFRGTSPTLIDSLSFEPYVPNRPWIAYRQFCQHFLAPLLLIGYRDVRLAKLLSTDINGIPLDLASKVLPWKTMANFSILSHVHLHAQAGKTTTRTKSTETFRVSETGLTGIVEDLRGLIRRLSWKPPASTWRDYYNTTNYSDHAISHKEAIIKEIINRISPKPTFAIDFGGNNGKFSRLFSSQGIYTVSLDIDFSCVELNYKQAQQEGDKNILPLVFDLVNPSPAIGWQNLERGTLLQRVGNKAGVAMALALIHHLVISNNIPMTYVARYFAEFAPKLIIEFVPQSDSQVQRLLSTRQLPADYSEASFFEAMEKNFRARSVTRVCGTDRTICFFERE